MTTTEIDDLILSNRGLAYHIARNMERMFCNKLELEDIKSIAIIGLVKAAQGYDNKKGKFTSYAGQCIRHELLMELRKQYKKPINIDSLNKLISFDGNKSSVELIDVIPAPLSTDFENMTNIDLSQYTKVQQTIIKEALNGKSQRQIAKVLGMSQSYISKEMKFLKGVIKYEIN